MALLRFKAAFVPLLLPIALFPQTNPQTADMNDTIEMMRSLAALERIDGNRIFYFPYSQ